MHPRNFVLGGILFVLLPSLTSQVSRDSIPVKLDVISRLTIELNPIIQQQTYRVLQAQAGRQQASSFFDYRLIWDANFIRDELNLFAQDSRFVSTDGRLHTNTYSYGAGLQRTFRSGLQSTLRMDYSRIANNYPFNNFGEERAPYLSENFTTVSISLRQPLWRGRGRRYTTAFERSAAKQIEGADLDLSFIATSQLRAMVSAYWGYLNSYKQYYIFQQNEARVRTVLQITQELVDADKKAQNDLIQVQADLAAKERQTLQAEQSYYRAKQNLGRAIGLNEEESRLLGVPQSEFPSIEGSFYAPEMGLSPLLELARKNRADIQALVKSKEALEISLDRSLNDLKPQLDLVSSFSYGGTDIGNQLSRIVTPLNRLPGRNTGLSLGVSFQFPLNNNAAKASVQSEKAALDNQLVRLENQLRNIELNISIAHNELHNSVLRLEKAKESLAYYEQVFEDEQIKFKNGLSTLFNLILFQERLTFAQIDYLSAQQQFAEVLITLREETGTLLSSTAPFASPIDNQIFYQLPLGK